jgi:hypothetical protein
MIVAPLPRFAVTDAQYQALLPALRMLAGSSEVATLARALALTDGFALHLVGCETPHLALSLILWLASEVPRLQGAAIKMVRLEPTRTDTAEQASALDPMALGREVFDRLLIPDDEPRVVFLDATDSRTDDRPAWIWLFQRLNERRNHLAKIGAPLVLLLPFDLEVELTRFAPDLWSIRSAGLKLRKEPPMESRGLELPALSLSSNEERAGGLRSDVKALRAEVEGLLTQPGPHAQRALVTSFQRLAEALHDLSLGEMAQAESQRGDELDPR